MSIMAMSDASILFRTPPNIRYTVASAKSQIKTVRVSVGDIFYLYG